jgi:TPR repeat protein
MKSVWLAALAGTPMVGTMLAAAPATAQVAQQDPVKQGVDAWERGDYKAAVEKWRGPAIQGNADAQFNLGQAYKLGRGVTADLLQAEEWYRKAAFQGHPQAEDNYGLALFQNGKRGEAVRWLERSSNRGEPRAQFVLGTMYFNGDSVERDWVRAYALMLRASQSGLPQASTALAQMDKHVSLDERQQGLALARKYEESGNRPQPPVDYAAPAQVAAAKPAAVRDGGWRLQLGAFGDPNNARKLWSQIGGRFPGRQVYYVKAGNLTKVLVGPFASRADASGACRGVSPCVPVPK